VAQWRTRFTLDLAVAGCYDTSAGVGIVGRKKPETRKKKGVSVLWGVAAIIVLGVLFVWASDWLPKKLTGQDKKAAKKTEQQPAPVQQPQQSAPTHTLFEFADPPASVPPIQQDRTPFKAFYATGVVASGQRFVIQLADGRVLNETMDMVESWDGGRVMLKDGSSIWVLPRPRPQTKEPEKTKKAKEKEDGTETEQETGERQSTI